MGARRTRVAVCICMHTCEYTTTQCDCEVAASAARISLVARGVCRGSKIIARSAAVSPRALVRSGRAPAAISKCTLAACPHSAAQCSGLAPASADSTYLSAASRPPKASKGLSAPSSAGPGAASSCGLQSARRDHGAAGSSASTEQPRCSSEMTASG